MSEGSEPKPEQADEAQNDGTSAAAHLSSGSASPSSPLSIAQRLHTDALHSIFQFLHLSNPRNARRIECEERNRFLPAALTCRAWYAAAQSLKLRLFGNRHFWIGPEYFL